MGSPMTPSRPYDVGIAIGIVTDESAQPMTFDGLVAFFTDGAYWFVWQRLKEFDSARIPLDFFDCYGGASLTGAALEELDWFLKVLVGSLGDYPEQWEVHSGTQIAPERKELYQPVHKATLLCELAQLEQIVGRARAEGRTVASFGD
jgi:hypothetical protein